MGESEKQGSCGEEGSAIAAFLLSDFSQRQYKRACIATDTRPFDFAFLRPIGRRNWFKAEIR